MVSSTSIDSAFDSKLIAQIVSGDAKAVGKLFDRYAGLAYNLAFQMLQDGAKAEQILFELFMRLWHEAGQYDSSGEPVKTRLLQTTYMIAKAQLGPSDTAAEHWENLTDLELEELLTKEPAPAELLEKQKTKVMALIDPVWPKEAASAQSGERKSAALNNEKRSPARPGLDSLERGEKGEKGRSVWPILAFGFGIAASLLAVYSSFNARKLSKQLQELTVDLNVLRQDLLITRTQLDYALSPQTEVLTLTGQLSAPQAHAKLVWSPAEAQGFFSVTGLPPAPSDKSYQLWVIAGGKPVPVKTFNVDSAGSAQIRFAHLPPAEQIFAFNVTLELAGGVAEPTGEKLLSGARL